jgi:uncharacterized protein (DUF736 family)
MAIIGKFTPTKDGGWEGTIRTLSFCTEVRFVPNDKQDDENAPAFRVFGGWSELGAAWKQHGAGGSPKTYLGVRLDDPSFPDPVSAVLFETSDGKEALLIWRRQPQRLGTQQGN